MKNIPQVNQDNLTTLEPSSPITTNSRLQKTPEKEDSDTKSYLKMMIEILKQKQEEKHKKLEAFKKETRKTFKELKELEENRTKEMKEWKKEFKTEMDTIKKTLKETTLEVENLKEE